MRRLVVAGAILAALLTWPLSLAAAFPENPALAGTDSQRATAALEYLLAAQSSNGSIDSSLGETADFVIGAAAAGYDPSTLRGCSGGTGALSYLATASDAAASDAAKTGKAILAVVAAGGDPAAFSGRDLSARLAALYHSTTGSYGDGATFSQAFAILAVVASGGSAPAAATAKLIALQDPDGSWSYGTAPVPAGEGDTNSTAIALMALDAAGVHTADATALAYLHSQQLPDGGFPYQNSSVYGPPASDPDSDALVLEAIVAVGQNPEAAAWTAAGGTVLTHLRSMQGADGGFEYPGYGESAFTTSQVPAALMRAPYGAPVSFTAGRAVPATSCATPSPSAVASTSATATPTHTPTHAPTPTPTKKPTSKPTIRPTAAPTATPDPTDPTEPTALSPSAAIEPTASPTASATQEVAGATSVPTSAPSPSGGVPVTPESGEIPVALVYLAAALGGVCVVAVGGWLYADRPWERR
jgi:cell division septation protein DedD